MENEAQTPQEPTAGEQLQGAAQTIENLQPSVQVETELPVAGIVAGVPEEKQPETAQSVSINGRPCQVILLPISGYKVFMAEYLTAGEDEDAMALLFKDVESSAGEKGEIPFQNGVSFKHKRLETGIKRIVTRDGQDAVYTMDWYRDLPKTDSDPLLKFIENNYSETPEKKS